MKLGAFRLSASNLRANSIIPNSYLDRKTMNFNGSQNVTKKLSVNLVANYVVETSHNKSSLSDGPGNPNNVQFLAPNEDQSILSPGTLPSCREQTFTNDTYVTNPYFAAYNFSSDTKRNRLISSASAKYNFTDWLYAQARLGYDNINDVRIDITPTGTAYDSTNGNMRQTNTQITELNTDVLISSKHDIVKDFLNVDASVGGNIRSNNYGGTYISGNSNGFTIPYFYSLTNFPARNSGYIDNQSIIQTNSAYYTADFAIKQFLVLSTTGRYDTYSSLPSANRGIFSPSVSGSFIFSDLYPLKGLDFGKIRASYAKQAENQPDLIKLLPIIT